MKKIGLVASLILMGNVLFAQSIKEGKQFLNRERYESAEAVFQKLLASDPNNIEAAYWLGQTYLDNDRAYIDTAAAKALYQKTLQANPNNALMMIGMGEINLMEGNKDAARNQFETAINNTKKRELPDILYAVGRANIEPNKGGDIMYGIQKLQQATERDKKNPEIYNEIGYGYWKLHDGANATINFQTALSLDPADAMASFFIGRIYETQGYGQEPIYMRYYQDAMREDPNYAPVYYWLYTYYYNRDVNKAAEYLNKYIAVADNDSKNCYAKAALLFVSKKYEQTITQADGCIDSAAGKSDPNLYGLKGYAYDKLGDSLKAKESFDKFFAVANPEKIGPNDYKTYGQILFKIPGQEAEAVSYINKAIDLDTLVANKIQYAKDVAQNLANQKKYAEAGQWYTRVLSLDSNYGKTDLFYAGYDDFLGGDYPASDSVFKIYQQKYPDDVYGWFLGAHAVEAMDTAETGKAKPLYEKVIEIGDSIQNKDSIKDKLIPAYRFMVAYYYNIKHQTDSAIVYNDKILGLDPTDATALKTKDALDTVVKQQKEAADKPSATKKK
ncbi:MAG: tetratricopeptide repeat protein [Bacteroidota bacterium]|nr:tetratricopeptide repeat protein [Bacteroidota bacterium]